MVAIKSHLADKYIKEPPQTLLACLIYGTDEGRISENASVLARNWSEKYGDGGEIIRIDERALSENPDIVSIELRSTPMFGGRSVIRLTAGNRIKPGYISELLELEPENFLIMEAGNLKPSSALRKLFEKAKNTAAIPCYPDESRDIDRLVEEELVNKGISVSPQARKILQDNLGSDRGISRQELEKLALYAHDKQRIDLEDIEAMIGDSSRLAYDQLITLILSGDGSGALQKLERLLATGQTSAGLTTVLGRHLARLFKVRTMMENGKDAKGAIATLRPPVHFRQKDIMAAQVSRLSLPALKKAIHLVQETVSRSRRQSELEQTATERMIIILSQIARKGS